MQKVTDRLVRKNELRKLSILKKIIEANGRYTLQELAASHGMSKKTLTRDILQLNEEVKDVFEVKIEIVQKDKMCILVNPTNQSGCYLVDKLRLYYLHKSTDFLVLQTLLETKFVAIDFLADELFISVSYLYKRLQKIKPILDVFHLELCFSEMGGNNFIGKEEHFRLCYFHVLWSSYRGLEQPFEQLQDELSVPYLKYAYGLPNQLSSKDYRVDYLLQISAFRKINNRAGLDVSDFIRPLLEVIVSENNLFYLPDSPVKASFNYQNDLLFLNFAIRNIVAELDSDDMKSQIMTSMYRLNHPIVAYCDLLLVKLAQTFNLKMSQVHKDNFMYFLTLHHIDILYLGVDMTAFNGRQTSASANKGALKSFYTNFLLQNQLSEDTTGRLNTFEPICLLLEYIVDYYQVIKIQIMIEDTENEVLIKAKLLSLYNTELLVFTNDESTADIIITNNNHAQNKSAKQFVLKDYDDRLSWENLVNLIKNKALDSAF